MSTYEVQPQTKVRVKRLNTMWLGTNIDMHTTVNLNIFTDQDLILDPATAFAPIENTSTARIKARWLECGYYGFRRGQWLMLVPKKLVIRRESC